jgi:hypothetical protein
MRRERKEDRKTFLKFPKFCNDMDILIWEDQRTLASEILYDSVNLGCSQRPTGQRLVPQRGSVKHGGNFKKWVLMKGLGSPRASLQGDCGDPVAPLFSTSQP